MEKELTLTATYDRDSKRYHRFLIDLGQKITGTIYIPKDQPVPDALMIRLRTKNVENRGFERISGGGHNREGAFDPAPGIIEDG